MIDLHRAALLAKGDDKYAVTVSRAWLREVVAEISACRAQANAKWPTPHLDVVPDAVANAQ
ncbi:hypothetical protein [uncultured Novosphingobium sp.]|uniref:hypothetical protein n=1 Tax=uncultured Novosphingobium sp. TaxID=292277 RepID=UPI002598F4B9|nr:hypothetical protein [uncultured Novosphingobium sp.]